MKPARHVVFCLHASQQTQRNPLYRVTNNLVRRIHKHKSQWCDGSTARYDVHHLFWFEITESIEAAIQREKQLKNWKRDWKMALIEK